MRSSALRFGKKKKRGGLLNAAAKESKRKKKGKTLKERGAKAQEVVTKGRGKGRKKKTASSH